MGLPAEFSGVIDLLAPLTSAADLPTHPSMSIPYKSSILTDMVQHASELLHHERKTLWNMKHILTKLRGDETWIPCGALNSNVDDIIFNTGPIYNEIIESELKENLTSSKGPSSMNGEVLARTFKQPGAVRNNGPSLFGASIAGTRRNSDVKTHGPGARDSGVGPPHGPVSESAVAAAAAADTASKSQKNLEAVHDVESNVEIKEELLPIADNILHGSSLSEKLTADDSRPLNTDNGPEKLTTQSIKLNVHGEHTGVLDSMERRPPPGPKEALRADDASTLKNSEDSTMTDHDVQPNAIAAANEESIGADDVPDASQAAPRRMQTRAQAQAKSENTASSRTRSASPAWTAPTAHPLFLMPVSAYPDRDFGLPPGEAEETRRMVTLYAQKQEEVCRSAEKLYNGLAKADRMRKTVFKWCKAEGHVGEMSDGEDWYDKEEWGLDEDLRKGQEEEEEDKDKDKEGTGTQGKKTRKARVTAVK